MTITVDRFLTGLKRRVTHPANDQRLKDADLLEMADDCMRDMVVPLILGSNQNYFVTHEDIPTVANQAEYDIPERAMGRGLRDLKLVRSDGSVRDVNLISLEDEHYFAKSGEPSGFYFKGDLVVLVPAPVNTDLSIRMLYNMQPSRLTSTSSAAKVSSISGDTVVCETAGSGMASGINVDFVRGKAACRVLAKDIVTVSLSGSTFAFNVDAVPDSLQVGDYISVAGTTPVLQIPDEGAPYLEAVTSQRMLEAISDFEGAKAIADSLPTYSRNFSKVLSPRIEGETTKIVNRQGLLRGKGFSSWRVRGGFYY